MMMRPFSAISALMMAMFAGAGAGAADIKLSDLSDAVQKRFWALVRYNVMDTDIHWPWKGAIDKDGHGKFKLNGQVVYAHRVAYALVHGRTPRKKMVLHACNNPKCCNPAHLYEGGAVENALDYWEEKQGRAKARRA
jgi:hypothetical protein